MEFSKISRRAFIASTGLAVAGVGTGLFLSGKIARLQDKLHDLANKSDALCQLFIHIGGNNRIKLVSHRVEMGQGIKSSLPLILADELEADWNLVDVIQAPANKSFGDQDTAGSRSIKQFFELMRDCGATVRLMLERAAADQWKVSPDECKAINHRIVHIPSNRQISFGELSELLALQPIPSKDEIQLKERSEFRYIGKYPTRSFDVDINDKITGRTIYAADVRLPDMLYATVKNAPVIGARLLEIDDSAARKVKGVIAIFPLPTQEFPAEFKPLHGVAIVATNTWAAMKAKELLNCRWSTSKYSTRGSTDLRNELLEKIATPGENLQSTSTSATSAAFQKANQIYEATYTMPYLAHACMEPPATAASAKPWSCEVWASSQNPQSVQQDIASILNIPAHRTRVNVQPVGGGFGRKSKGDYCAQAALISKVVGKPINLIWSREEDIKFDYYHPLSVQHYAAALNENQEIIGWLQRAAYPSINSTFFEDADKPKGELNGGFLNSPFQIENIQSEVHSAKESVRIGWLRGVSSIQHAFANNCFADELAHKRNINPVEHLISLLSSNGQEKSKPSSKENYRLIKTIEKVTKECGWDYPKPHNSGWGIAAHASYHSFCAAATRVTVNNDTLTINEVHLAIDCGLTINENQLRAQMEGSIIWGLSLALTGEITIDKGEVQQSNFHDYQILRINQCPSVHVYIMRSDEPPTGAGESGVPPIAPSITNAIYSACGKRIRDLPLNKHFKI